MNDDNMKMDFSSEIESARKKRVSSFKLDIDHPVNEEIKEVFENNPKDENTLREIIHELSQITGKEVSPEKENKIIEAIQKDRIPNQMDKMF